MASITIDNSSLGGGGGGGPVAFLKLVNDDILTATEHKVADQLNTESSLSLAVDSATFESHNIEIALVDMLTIYGRTGNIGRALIVSNHRDVNDTQFIVYDAGNIYMKGDVKVDVVPHMLVPSTRIVVWDVADNVLKYRTPREIYSDIFTKATISGITLLPASWSPIGAVFQATISNALIEAGCFVTTIPSITTLTASNSANILLFNNVAAGNVIIYAQNLPLANITVDLKIIY
jgi:hypothetical protein